MRALLVIDVQKEFKDSNGKYEEAIEFVKNSKKDYDCIIAIAFVHRDGGMFDKHMTWDGCKNVSKESIEYEYDCLFTKDTYAFDVKTFLPKSIEYDVIGCNTEACVLATCFRLWDEEYNFNILVDKIYSTWNGVEECTMNEMFINTFGSCVKTSHL